MKGEPIASTYKTVILVNLYPDTCQIGLTYETSENLLRTPRFELPPDGAAILAVTDASDKPYPETGSTFFRATSYNMKNQGADSSYDGNWGDVIYALGIAENLPYVKGGRATEIIYPS